jgi:hypothetical protein
MNTKYIHIFAFIRSFLMPSPIPVVPTPGKDLFYLPVIHVVKVYIDSPRGFYLGIPDMYILCFTQINPHYLLYHSDPLLLIKLQCFVLHYLHI